MVTWGGVALVCGWTLAFGAPTRITASAPTAITAPAEVTEAAVRLPDRMQLEPPAAPPTYGGCLIGDVVTVSASTDAQQRWRVGTVPGTSGRWKSALAPTAGLRGPVVVIGDSLTVGALTNVMRELLDAGYGPVCIDGAVGRRINGTAPLVSSGLKVTARIKASDPVWQLPQVHWVVGFGTNDTRGFASQFNGLIQSQIDAIGATLFPICWINVRTLVAPYDTVNEPAWNALLARPTVRIIDWWSAIDPALATYIASDNVHATALGSALRARLVLVALNAT